MNNNLIPYEELGLTESRKEIINQFIYYKKQLYLQRIRRLMRRCIEND